MQLPGEYATPRGRLLLAFTDTLIAGSVALRDLDNGVCEVRRLFVRPQARGLGLGRALMTTVMAEARIAGYPAIRLETLETMCEAQALYRSLGFVEIAPYRPPTSEHDRTVSMELTLSHP